MKIGQCTPDTSRIQTQSLISRLYRKAGGLAQQMVNRQLTDRYIFIMPTRKLGRTLASFHLNIQDSTPSESSTSLRISEDTLYSEAGLGEMNTEFSKLVCRPQHETHLHSF